MTGLSRVSAVFRFASATRIRLESRSLAAQLDDLLSIRLRRRRESCIAAFLLIGDVPLLAHSTRDLVELERLDLRDRVIDFSAGLCVSPETPATADKAAARHQTRVRARRFEPTTLMGFFSFAGFVPTAGALLFPASRACMLFGRLLAAIYFRRGIVRPKGSLFEKGRAIMSFRFSFQASLPQSIRLAAISLAMSRSCLGFCLLQGFGRTYRRNAAGTTP